MKKVLFKCKRCGKEFTVEVVESQGEGEELQKKGMWPTIVKCPDCRYNDCKRIE